MKHFNDKNIRILDSDYFLFVDENLRILFYNEEKFLDTGQAGSLAFKRDDIIYFKAIDKEIQQYHKSYNLKTDELVELDLYNYFYNESIKYYQKITDHNYFDLKFYKGDTSSILYEYSGLDRLEFTNVRDNNILLVTGDYRKSTKIKRVNLDDISQTWELELITLKPYVTEWESIQKNMPEYAKPKEDGIFKMSNILRFDETIVFTINNEGGFNNKLCLVGIDLNTGAIKWVNKKAFGSFQLFDFDGKLFYRTANGVSNIDPETGDMIKNYDFKSLFPKNEVTDFHWAFNINEGKILLIGKRKLNVVMIDMEKKALLFEHHFERGKDINEETVSLVSAIYFKGQVFVNNDLGDLFIFDVPV